MRTTAGLGLAAYGILAWLKAEHPQGASWTDIRDRFGPVPGSPYGAPESTLLAALDELRADGLVADLVVPE